MECAKAEIVSVVQRGPYYNIFDTSCQSFSLENLKANDKIYMINESKNNGGHLPLIYIVRIVNYFK